MARPNRSDLISPDESCIVHVFSRVVRRCFLMGDDPLTGKNYDHRKVWIEDYLALLDWTARQPVAGKRGVTPSDTPAILQRLGLEADVWCELSRDFDKLFSLVAGRPASIDQARTRSRQARFHTRPRTRELMSA